MGTYSDEAPDASVGERLTNSIRKIAGAVAGYTAPRSVVQRKPALKIDEGAAEGQQDQEALARMRRGQSTDTNNSYNF